MCASKNKYGKTETSTCETSCYVTAKAWVLENWIDSHLGNLCRRYQTTWSDCERGDGRRWERLGRRCRRFVFCRPWRALISIATICQKITFLLNNRLRGLSNKTYSPKCIGDTSLTTNKCLFSSLERCIDRTSRSKTGLSPSESTPLSCDWNWLQTNWLYRRYSRVHKTIGWRTPANRGTR